MEVIQDEELLEVGLELHQGLASSDLSGPDDLSEVVCDGLDVILKQLVVRLQQYLLALRQGSLLGCGEASISAESRGLGPALCPQTLDRQAPGPDGVGDEQAPLGKSQLPDASPCLSIFIFFPCVFYLCIYLL